MSDNIIPFRRRDEKPLPKATSEVKASEPAITPDGNDEWTLVQIVAKAPPTSR